MVQRLPDIQLQSGIPVTSAVPPFVKGFIIGNESGLSCTVEMQGLFNPKNLYPGTVDFFPCEPNFSGNILINNVTMLSNVSSWPSSFLTVDMVTLQDKVDTSLFPMALPTRQTTTPTTSGNPIFSATVGYGATATDAQSLNIYNPANSGVLYEFHSARVFTNDSTIPTCNLAFTSGPDNNYLNPVSTVCHFCSVLPPISTAHATSVDSTGVTLGTILEVVDVQQDTTIDFLLFPDKIVVLPGNNVTLTIVSSSTAHIVRLTAKWTEVPLTALPSSGGGTTPGNILTAANIINQGNAAGTGIIAAYPLADGINAVFMDNEGNVIYGSLLRDGDFQVVSATLGGTVFHIIGSSGTILFDGAQPFPGDSFTFHSQSGANQLKVTDTGAEFFNQAKLDGGVKFPTGSISQINTFTVAVTTTPTVHAHGLTVPPTGYGYIFTGTGNTAGSLQVSSVGPTNLTLTASGNFTAIVTVYAL